MEKKRKASLYLGDPEHNKKMMRVYAWIVPVVFLGMAILMLISGGWLPALLFFCVGVLYLPRLKDFFARIWLKGALKAVLAIALAIAGVYSTVLYV